MLPLPNANQVLVFANDARLFDRALYWMRTLDTASALGNGEGFFVYNAENMSAEELGALVTQSGAGQQEASVTPPEVAVRRVNGAPELGIFFLFCITSSSG